MKGWIQVGHAQDADDPGSDRLAAMPSLSHPLQFVLVALARWINQQQRDVIDYLQEDNRVLREQLGGRRLRFTDDQRRRLAANPGYSDDGCCTRSPRLSRPTRCWRVTEHLIAKQYDGSTRRGLRRPPVMATIRALIVRMATENRGRGYTRIQQPPTHFQHGFRRTLTLGPSLDCKFTSLACPSRSRRRARTRWGSLGSIQFVAGQSGDIARHAYAAVTRGHPRTTKLVKNCVQDWVQSGDFFGGSRRNRSVPHRPHPRQGCCRRGRRRDLACGRCVRPVAIPRRRREPGRLAPARDETVAAAISYPESRTGWRV